MSHPAGDFASQEVIRPAAVLSEVHARQILLGLATDDVQSGGHWWTRVGTWRRYESPWAPVAGLRRGQVVGELLGLGRRRGQLCL